MLVESIKKFTRFHYCQISKLRFFKSLKKMLIKWTKPNQDWTEPSVLSTLVHHSAEPCMRRLVQLSSACGPALPNFWRRARTCEHPHQLTEALAVPVQSSCLLSAWKPFLSGHTQKFQLLLIMSRQTSWNLDQKFSCHTGKKCRFTKCVIVKLSVNF